MRLFLKFILFLGASAAGYGVILLMPYVAWRLGISPDIPVGPGLASFQRWYFVGSFLAYLAGVLVAIGFFFTRGAAQILLLCAPILATTIFGAGVFAYFSR